MDLSKLKIKKPKKLSRKERQALNKQIIEMTARIFYKFSVINMRGEYKGLFADRLLQNWDIYIREVLFALDRLLAHERKFLEDCFWHNLTYEKMFVSRSTFYRSLVKYSAKFLSLFDYELYHKHLASIYNSILDPDDTPPTNST